MACRTTSSSVVSALGWRNRGTQVRAGKEALAVRRTQALLPLWQSPVGMAGVCHLSSQVSLKASGCPQHRVSKDSRRVCRGCSTGVRRPWVMRFPVPRVERVEELGLRLSSRVSRPSDFSAAMCSLSAQVPFLSGGDMKPCCVAFSIRVNGLYLLMPTAVAGSFVLLLKNWSPSLLPWLNTCSARRLGETSSSCCVGDTNTANGCLACPSGYIFICLLHLLLSSYVLHHHEVTAVQEYLCAAQI